MLFTKGEFFNGPGGFGIGAKLASVVDKNGIEYRVAHQWSNDIDESACETYINNICPDRPGSVILGDVRWTPVSGMAALTEATCPKRTQNIGHAN